MKTLLLFAALLISSATAYAQVNATKSIVCASTSAIVSELRSSQYNEQPLWYGADTQGNTHYTLFTNNTSRAWTLVQFNEGTACILGTGTGSKTLIGVDTKG